MVKIMISALRTTSSNYQRIVNLSRSFSIIPFKLADIGEGIAEVELMKWFVKEGDKVKSFDRICEVQSDKATVEITSRYDGTIVKIHHAEGGIVKVGDALLDINTSLSGATKSKLGNGPADPSLPASSHSTKPASPRLINPTYLSSSESRALSTPAVRKIAKEYGLDLNAIVATGPKGRITKEDVLLNVQRGNRTRVPLNSTVKIEDNSSSKTSMPVEEGGKVKDSISAPTSTLDKRVPVRGVQRLMVKSMTAALQVQHLTYCEEISFDKMRVLRSTLKSQLSKKGVKISYMPLLIKATSLTLNEFPILNATVSNDISEMIYHYNHNIGIAMDTPKGLVVPVLKQVQEKSVVEIAIELAHLQDAALSGSLTEEQLRGGTFSLSNIGSVGGTYAVPVVVVPQVMIGAFGRVQLLPRYLDSQGNLATVEMIEEGEADVKPSAIMNVSWSADHRVIDGATVARFSNLWKSYLENPSLMLSEMK